MSLEEIKNNYHCQLDSIYGTEETASIFYLALEHVLSMTRSDFVLSKTKQIEITKEASFAAILNDLKNHKPIQYILGETSFYGINFKVNNSVLIPRQETEELVDWIISENKARKDDLCILDIGTGSGCIAITLARFLASSNVYALDVSQKALEVAKYNADINGTDIEFVLADALNPIELKTIFTSKRVKKFDVMVSNPPYVRQSEISDMKSNVLDYEPHLALFVDDSDALKFYKAIIGFSQTYLKSEGQLFFEINQYLGEQLLNLLKDSGFKSSELRTDLNGNHRMIKAIKNF